MKVRLSLLTLLVIALITSPCRAQDTTGRLQGKILDKNGTPIAAVNIIVEGPRAQGVMGAFTLAGGSFLVSAIPPGVYRVTVTHLAYQTVVFEGVRIQLGTTTHLKGGIVELSERVLEGEVVTVTAEQQPVIDLSSTTIGGTLDLSDVETIPTSERDYQSLATILPVPPKNSVCLES